MKLPYPKRKRLAEDQGSIRAIFKKMGRTNLDGPFKRG
jgi:hypothetical protein